MEIKYLQSPIVSLNDVELLCGKLGDLDTTKKLVEYTETLCYSKVPNTSPDIVKFFLNSLRRFYSYGDDYGETQNLYDFDNVKLMFETILAYYRETYPQKHPNVIRAKLNLGLFLEQYGNLYEAKSLFEEMLTIYSPMLNLYDPDIIEIKHMLGLILLKQGHKEKARSQFNDVLALYIRSPFSNQPYVKLGLQILLPLYNDPSKYNTIKDPINKYNTIKDIFESLLVNYNVMIHQEGSLIHSD
ncbi:MAG: tetratricopeptide repeat protein [Candidatus Odinarchaeia archaeon]